MRTDIEFKTEDGVGLRGWRYRPENGGGPWPTIVMAHGYSAVKEMDLDRFAEVFAAAGLAAIVFDNRNFGASGGEPRQEINPWRQIDDYRDAISFAQSLPETDAERIGVWGSSYSGGHAIVLGAIDRRIKCVVSQVPLISGRRAARRLIRGDLMAGVETTCEEDRRNRYKGEAPRMISVVSSDTADPAVLPTADAWRWFSETGKTRAPTWRNEVTLRSVELFLGYEPGSYIAHVSPTPLLLVVALSDHLTPADEALAAYEQALHPKKLVMLKGGHFDAYVAEFDTASVAARDWFAEHLHG
ncbi:MAG: alpha/beta hydrolase [Hyphomicrobium sp.]